MKLLNAIAEHFIKLFVALCFTGAVLMALIFLAYGVPLLVGEFATKTLF